MSVAACYTCRNEADIVEASFRHMLAEGIAHIYTTDHLSTDGSREIMERLAAETGRITIIGDRDPFQRQIKMMTLLAEMVDASLHSCHASFEVEHAFIEA